MSVLYAVGFVLLVLVAVGIDPRTGSRAFQTTVAVLAAVVVSTVVPLSSTRVIANCVDVPLWLFALLYLMWYVSMWVAYGNRPWKQE